jgi:hypothetical protein
MRIDVHAVSSVSRPALSSGLRNIRPLGARPARVLSTKRITEIR